MKKTYIYFLAVPCSLRDLISPTRDQTYALGIESAESVNNHWTAREVPPPIPPGKNILSF